MKNTHTLHRSMKLLLALLLCFAWLLPAFPAAAEGLPAAAGGQGGSSAPAFRYEHDPRLNPKAMADIVPDPTAVYGFAPSPEGSLSSYAAFDWSDPELVNGESGRLARIAYHESINEMYAMMNAMQLEGRDIEEIARAVSSKRNELRIAAYEEGSAELAAAKARNLEKYGHEEGPLPDELYEQYGSWETVLEKAFSVNSGMDACLGLYDDYYALYVMAGQVEDEHTASASREYAVAAFIDAAGLPGSGGSDSLAAFGDADTVSTYYSRELAAAVDTGVLRGYEDHTLRPRNTISRVEAMLLLSRCLPDLEATTEAIPFTDLPAWAKAEIDRLSSAGLVLGYGGNVLGAGDDLTVEQVGLLTARVAAANQGLRPQTEPDGSKQENGTAPLGGSRGFTEFDSSLIAFLEERGLGEESFMVSPLSFRAALALAAAGAEGSTKEALLEAMGFSDLEEVKAWYDGVLEGVDRFQKDLDQELAAAEHFPEDFYGSAKPDRAYSIANSLWHNADRPGGFREDYKRLAAEWFDAAAEEAAAGKLTDAVNAWVNKKTRGMIPFIANDLSEMDAVLVNALYLRTTWMDTFSEDATHPDKFNAADGHTVTKDFMKQQNNYAYYEDEDTQLVVLPMKGNIRAVFVLGDAGHISDKLEQTEWNEVVVTLPKFELETTLDDGELTDYLRHMGAGEAMTEAANFSAMSDLPWCIGDILQKSKLKVDEDGIEAAAVTAIMMPTTAVNPADPPQPKYFTADRPFSFYIYYEGYSGTEAPELLFYGQYLG